VGKREEQKKKKTTKKRRPNAAYYFERRHGRNMVRRALRMVKGEAKYQRWLGRTQKKRDTDPAKLQARSGRALTAARECAEQHLVLGRFNTELERLVA